MGLLNKIFKAPDRTGPDTVLPTDTRFEESDGHDDDALERETSRRELVKLVLRESMRRHAVPSDWIECRMLPVVTSKRKTGVHVQLIVKQGQASLLGYIPAFQSSLMAELEKYDARPWDWLLSISWQFAGITSSSGGQMPGAGDWNVRQPAAGAASLAGGAAVDQAKAAQDAMDAEDADVAEDLKALFAIRDAVLKTPGDDHQQDFEATRPAGFEPTGEDKLR
jgi:hypothetical protein